MHTVANADFQLYYELDGDDHIISVGGTWDQQATFAGTPQLLGHHVKKTHLRDHINDAHTWWITKGLMDQARRHFMPLSMTYRCDTPTNQRAFVMIVTNSGADCLRISHQMISSIEAGPTVTIHNSAQRGAVVERCSICNRIREGNEWKDPFTLGTDLELIPDYTVCADCTDRSAVA